MTIHSINRSSGRRGAAAVALFLRLAAAATATATLTVAMLPYPDAAALQHAFAAAPDAASVAQA